MEKESYPTPCTGDSLKDLLHEVRALQKETGQLKAYIRDLTSNQALISGPQQWVPDTAFSSSTNWNGRDDHGPWSSRINAPKAEISFAFAWVRDASDKNGWIQVDLGRTMTITGVVTQGRGDSPYTSEHVKSYKMATFCPSTSTVHFYQDGMILPGNTEELKMVKNELDPPLVGRYIRLYPVDYHKNASLRWELFGHPAVQL